MRLELEADDARVVVDLAAGGRLASLRVRDLELLVPRNDDPLRWGCYPMAPWAGRLRDGRLSFRGHRHALPRSLPPHAIHGTTYLREWAHEGDGWLATDLGADWPFPGRARQQVRLSPSHLDLRLEVHSDQEPFPASLGWHPWFARRLTRGGPATLAFTPARMYLRDAAGIPTGETTAPTPPPWDDCFTGLSSPPTLTWENALQLTIESTATHWVAYTEPLDALCIEPQTGPPDALNFAPRIVHPGDPLVATARLCWRLADGLG